MDIRPEVQEACDKLHANAKEFETLHLDIPKNLNRLNQAETDALITALRANTHVQIMRFKYCHKSGPENSAFLDYAAETLIPSHPSLQKLMLIGNNLEDDEVVEKIAGALKSNTRMRSFFLGFNRLGGNGVRALAESVRHNSGLKSFRLTGNKLGLDSCRTVVSSVSAKPNFNLFHRLGLNYNNIGVEGSKVIADFIPKAKSLVHLGLKANSLGDEGCQFIATALPKTCSLLRLEFSQNNITDLGCLSVADALRNNCSLCELDLRSNCITDNGAAALLEPLQHVNYSVEMVDLNGNDEVTDEQREQIDLLCNANLRITRAFRHLDSNPQKIPLGLWPKALEAIETKPDLLFTLIKSQPELFRERRAPRKRNRPELL